MITKKKLPKGFVIAENIQLSKDIEINIKHEKDQVTTWWEETKIASYGDNLEDAIEGLAELINMEHILVMETGLNNLSPEMKKSSDVLENSLERLGLFLP